jgi:hypothetical protein
VIHTITRKRSESESESGRLQSRALNGSSRKSNGNVRAVWYEMEKTHPYMDPQFPESDHIRKSST